MIKSTKLNSVKRLAIGEIKVIEANELVLRDRKGNWSVREHKLKTSGVDQEIKLTDLMLKELKCLKVQLRQLCLVLRHPMV